MKGAKGAGSPGSGTTERVEGTYTASHGQGLAGSQLPPVPCEDCELRTGAGQAGGWGGGRGGRGRGAPRRAAASSLGIGPREVLCTVEVW